LKSQHELTPDERAVVVSALQHFDGQRYELSAYVVMNDHVHVLVSPLGKYRLQDIMHSWKSYTASRLQREYGRYNSVWQDEYFDRIVRDEEEFLEKAQYILNNPRQRWPDIEEYPWVGVKGEAEVGTEAHPTSTKTRPTNEDKGPGKGQSLTGVAAPSLVERPSLAAQSGHSAPWIEFKVISNVPQVGGNTAQRREHDKLTGVGTMSRSGALCPCCGTIMTMEDIRLEGQAGRLGTMMTAVVVDSPNGKEYRLPTKEEIRLAAEAEKELTPVFAEIPFSLPEQLINTGSIRKGGVSITRYGFRS